VLFYPNHQGYHSGLHTLVLEQISHFRKNMRHHVMQACDESNMTIL